MLSNAYARMLHRRAISVNINVYRNHTLTKPFLVNILNSNSISKHCNVNVMIERYIK